MGAVADIKRLVIVESPAKAKTIASYLGPGYIVDSSLGHIRDLPRNAKEIPAKYKDKAWSRLGVDVDNDFAPLYIVNPDRSAHVKKLKGYLAEVDEVFLATDEDREGEAIAWHLLETLKPKVPVKRMVFHEITPQAIAEAAANPRELNQDLVDAQEARRILDRLYGYEVSPVLWKKVMPRLSAGRVQSVATRIVVERERARMAFRTADYWDVTASLATDDGRAVQGHAHRRRTATGSPPARTSTPPPAASRATSSTSTSRAPAGSPGASRAATSPSSRSRRSRTGASPTRRSSPPRCSRRPGASSASPAPR